MVAPSTRGVPAVSTGANPPRQPVSRSSHILAFLSFLVGCGPWPTYTDLPSAGEVVPADEDPRDGVTLEWISSDVAPDTLPPGGTLPALTVGKGVRVTGTLSGIGWHDEAVPELLSGGDCASTGRRTPPVDGDWIGDVHARQLQTSGSGRLCATFEGGDGQQGFDILLWRLDACGVPSELVMDDDGTPIGLTQAGPYIDWSVVVDGERDFSVLVAGFGPNRLEEAVDYTLTLSMVEDGTLCPSAVAATP